VAADGIAVNAGLPAGVNTHLIRNKAMDKALRPDLDNPSSHDVTPFELPPRAAGAAGRLPRDPIPGVRQSRLPQRRDAHPVRRDQRQQRHLKRTTRPSPSAPRTMPDPAPCPGCGYGFFGRLLVVYFSGGRHWGQAPSATGPGNGRHLRRWRFPGHHDGYDYPDVGS
jgi:hypothetical protein